ncbi:MAG: class SAM-dependent methyltransferase [Rickettsiales bacterium]|jgi:NADH dehydrogenase [ubiquinone] 1 alpha subcomplex assembly factor 7|nr:class SAM-dependent methyltransferase [Rickettsiales bacterium]
MTPLAKHLVTLIREQGPMNIAQFMAEALGHPQYGYYMAREPFGAEGDFTTAPEISQMFGELIGIWCAHHWQAIGAPRNTIVVELGPGRGTLMKDFLRGTKSVYGFHDAITIHLVESSPRLREIQAQTLKESYGVEVCWHEHVATLPSQTMLLVANEFFDALPVHQYVKTPQGWREKHISITRDGAALQFMLSPNSSPFTLALDEQYTQAPDGAVFEYSPLSTTIMGEMASRIAKEGGMGLIIDYGYTRTRRTPEWNETLQAVQKHQFHPILQDIGNADITAHVDFSALVQEAERQGVHCYGPVGQGHLFNHLGIEMRAKALLNHATPKQQEAIVSAVERLVTEQHMGILFKALAITHPLMDRPAGF